MPWLSLPDYARRTGTPESTVRAMIRAGKLEGHQEQRAPGDPRIVWKVWIDDLPESAADPSSEHPQHPQPSATHEAPQPQAATTEPPAAIMRLMDTVDRQADRIAALEREAGILQGRVEAQQAGIEQYIIDAMEQTERAARAEAEAAAARERAEGLARRLAAAEGRWWHRWTRRP